jgi:hypothetical protein
LTIVRLRTLSLAAAFVAAAVLPGPALGGARHLDSPLRAEIARAGAIPDAAGVARTPAAASSWGGVYTTAGGSVTIRVSDSYPQDDAVGQRWADFLASLVHGPELSTVTLFLAPLSEVQSRCGRGALACYGSGLIVAPGEDPAADVSAEAVVTHEYGHHVASSRSDAPWDAVEYGTKRWASYENVCAQTRAGRLFPGAEQDERYRLNPGEAFAETFRVLNQRRAGVPETPWTIVTTSLYPDDTALSLVEQDVTSPWTHNTAATYSGTLRRTAARSYSVATPYDGVFRVTLRTAGVRVAVGIYAGERRTLRAIAAARSTRSLSGTVCGARTYRVRLAAAGGSGSYRLTVSKP